MDKYRLYNETKKQYEMVISDEYSTVLPIKPQDVLRNGSQTAIEVDGRFASSFINVSHIPICLQY